MTLYVVIATVLTVLAVGGRWLARRWDAADDRMRTLVTGHQDAPPAGHRTLDQPEPACTHPRRAVAVVPARHHKPVGWLCPDCHTDRPEPAPYGPPRDPNRVAHLSDDRFAQPVRTGPRPPSGPAGVALAADEDVETFHVYSHQSAEPVRTFTATPYAPFPPDFLRSNLATYMRDSGHTEAYIAERLAEHDAKTDQVTAALTRGILTPTEARALLASDHTATPVRVNTGLGRGWPIDPDDDTRPL